MKDRPVRENALNISRRNLPHWQIGGSWYFITFRSSGVLLPPEARDIVAKAILHNHGKRYALSSAVVMPDHVHLLLMPYKKDDQNYYSLQEFLKPLKGFSARGVNRLMGRSGVLWQHESFDRIIRNEGEWREKYTYIVNNPVKAGLAERPEEYRWLLDWDDFLKKY